MNEHDDFRDRLISSQQTTPEFREKYERSLESMFIRQLTPGQRAAGIVVVLSGLVFVVGVALGFTTRIITVACNDVNQIMGIMAALLAVVVFGVTILHTRSLVKGNVDLRWQPQVMAWAVFYGLLLIAAIPIVLGFLHGSSTSTLFLIAFCLVPLVAAAAILILVYIEQSELNVREKLLEIELRLAEMGELMGKNQPE
jgi:drug/metabolite transporter (DMT)-like permease